jgi:hypothetical protein
MARAPLLCALLLAAAAAACAPGAAGAAPPTGPGGPARRGLRQAARGSRLTTEADVQLFFGRSTARWRAIRQPARREDAPAGAAGEGDEAGGGGEDGPAGRGAAGPPPRAPRRGAAARDGSSSGAAVDSGSEGEGEAGGGSGGGGEGAPAADEDAGPAIGAPAMRNATQQARAWCSALWHASSHPSLTCPMVPPWYPAPHQGFSLVLTPQQLDAIVAAAKDAQVRRCRQRPAPARPRALLSPVCLCGGATLLRASTQPAPPQLRPLPVPAGRRRRAAQHYDYRHARGAAPGPRGVGGAGRRGAPLGPRGGGQLAHRPLAHRCEPPPAAHPAPGPLVNVQTGRALL